MGACWSSQEGHSAASHLGHITPHADPPKIDIKKPSSDGRRVTGRNARCGSPAEEAGETGRNLLRRRDIYNGGARPPLPLRTAAAVDSNEDKLALISRVRACMR